jgi:hypothetical protein
MSKTYPWDYPVKLEQGNYVGLNENSDEFNVVVSNRHFPGRFNELALKNPEMIDVLVGFSDMQTVLGRPLIMLGSGRSLFYKDHYLKGVGITPLLNNWHSVIDPYHGSGHMLPSSGLRELLISDYFESMDLSDLIVPCTDLLLSESCESRKEMVQNVYGRIKTKDLIVPPIDKTLSSISVKKGRFFRYSNLLWYLANRAEDNLNTIDFLFHIFAELDPTIDIAQIEKMTFQDIMKTFRKSLDQGFINLVESSLNGVLWGSVNNNFAFDGRFLDLELPTVFDGPIFGISSPDINKPNLPLRIESLHYAAQMRKFTVYMENILKTFMQIQKWSNTKRAKHQVFAMDEFLKQLHNEVRKKSIIFNNDRLINFTFEYMKMFSNQDISFKRRSKDLIASNLHTFLTGDEICKPIDSTTTKLSQRAELGVRDYLHVPKGLNLLQMNKGASNDFQEALMIVEKSTTLQEAMDNIRSARQGLKAMKRKSLRIKNIKVLSELLA